MEPEQGIIITTGRVKVAREGVAKMFLYPYLFVNASMAFWPTWDSCITWRNGAIALADPLAKTRTGVEVWVPVDQTTDCLVATSIAKRF